MPLFNLAALFELFRAGAQGLPESERRAPRISTIGFTADA